MLGVILVGVWMVFVAGYLIWQQVTGDLADRAVSYQPSAVSHRLSAISIERPAEASIAAREDRSEVRRSLVYRPTGFSASAGGVGLTADS